MYKEINLPGSASAIHDYRIIATVNSYHIIISDKLHIQFCHKGVISKEQ